MTTSGALAGERVGRRERTIAQWTSLVVGGTLVAAGILGFIADASFDTGDGVSGDKLILFEVNGIHNLVHIGSGVLLLAMANTGPTAKAGLLGFGVIYALVTLVGFTDGEDVFGLIPVNGADNALHVLLTLVALAVGLSSPGRRRKARPAA